MKRRDQPSVIERAMVVLVCAVIVALGWSAPGSPRSGERFPCELCHCGCSDAQGCWTNCCCYTEAERWRWAKAHGIQPPWWLRPPPERTSQAEERPACCCATPGESHQGVPATLPPTPRRLDDETCKAKPKLRIVAMTVLTRLAFEPWQLVHALFTLDSAWRASRRPCRFSIGLDPPPPRTVGAHFRST